MVNVSAASYVHPTTISTLLPMFVKLVIPLVPHVTEFHLRIAIAAKQEIFYIKILALELVPHRHM